MCRHDPRTLDGLRAIKLGRGLRRLSSPELPPTFGLSSYQAKPGSRFSIPSKDSSSMIVGHVHDWGIIRAVTDEITEPLCFPKHLNCDGLRVGGIRCFDEACGRESVPGNPALHVDQEVLAVDFNLILWHHSGHAFSDFLAPSVHRNGPPVASRAHSAARPRVDTGFESMLARDR